MRQLVCVFVVLGLVVGLTTRSAQAQTTNGVTTGAERQALNDAYTLSEAARRANAPQSGSPGANKPLSTGSARPQTLTEKTAEMNALFGFETAEQKAAARRAVAQRERDNQAAQQRKEGERKATAEAERQAYAKDQDRRITSMVPWDKVGFDISDCSAESIELGNKITDLELRAHGPTLRSLRPSGG